MSGGSFNPPTPPGYEGPATRRSPSAVPPEFQRLEQSRLQSIPGNTRPYSSRQSLAPPPGPLQAQTRTPSQENLPRRLAPAFGPHPGVATWNTPSPSLHSPNYPRENENLNFPPKPRLVGPISLLMNPQDFGSSSSSMDKSDTSSPRSFAAKVKEGVASLSKHVPGSPSYKKEHSSPKMGISSSLPVNMGPNVSPTPYGRDHGTPSPNMSSRSLTPTRNAHEPSSRLDHQTPPPATKVIRSPANFLEEVINKTLVIPDRRHPRGVSDTRPGSTEDRDYGSLDFTGAPTSTRAIDTAPDPALIAASPPTSVPVTSDVEPVEISMSHLAITEARLAVTKARLRALPANDMYILGLSGATSLDDGELRLLAKARSVAVKDTDGREKILKDMYNIALTAEQTEKRMEQFHEQLVSRNSEVEEKGGSVQVTPKKFTV